MNENGLSPSGFSREITLIDYGFTTDKEQYVTEISIRNLPKRLEIAG